MLYGENVKNKINVVLSQMYYPVSIGKFFDFALRRRDDVNLYTTGPYTSNWIPWKNGMYLPEKHSKPPDFPIGKGFIGNTSVNPAIIEDRLPFKPDLWINADAGFAFSKPSCPYAIIATDPHVLHYDLQRRNCDKFYNMQKFYSKPNDIYLPYCADPVWHSPLEREKEYDVCLIGLQYQNRTDLVNRLRAKGLKVFYETGIVYDEYQEMYAKSKVALSWSSLQDLIARVFEGMLMKVPVVCNRVPDLPLHFEEYKHYLGFDTIDEAEMQIDRAIQHQFRASKKMANYAHEVVMENHLYDHRIQQILEDFDLI
jgi:hypothetical protein